MNSTTDQEHCPNAIRQKEDPSAAQAIPLRSYPRKIEGTFAGRYEIVDKIGQGGMASLYRVRDLLFGEELAIKVIRPEAARDAVSQKRFRQEARAARELNHPHIVNVRAFDISPEGVPFMIMDYVDGSDLGKLIKQSPLPLATFYQVCIQVAGALVHAHSRGVVHRDVKPSNILVTRQESGEVWVKLVDFGIAKLLYPLDEEDNTLSSLTRTGQTVGSPAYMSPEQIQARAVDARSDIYSFGVVMFEALTSQWPFQALNPLQLAMHHLNTMPPSITRLNKNVPADLERVIKRCLEKQPENRYQNMFDLRSDLQLLAQGREPLLRIGANCSSAAQTGENCWADLIRKDGQKEFLSVMDGQLSYELRLNNVLEQIFELGYNGDSILRLKSHNPEFTGIILLRDGRQVIAARMLNEVMSPFDALRRLLSLADGEYKYSIIKKEDYSAPECPFVLSLKYLISIYPNYESLSELVDQKALNDLLFAVKSGGRNAITGGEGGVEEIVTLMDDKNESWRPMAPPLSQPKGESSSTFIQEEYQEIQAEHSAIRRNKEKHGLAWLFMQSTRRNGAIFMTFVFIIAMLAMGYQIVQNSIPGFQQRQSGSIYRKKRRYRRHTYNLNESTPD